jgi:hypothetical protein
MLVPSAPSAAMRSSLRLRMTTVGPYHAGSWRDPHLSEIVWAPVGLQCWNQPVPHRPTMPEREIVATQSDGKCFVIQGLPVSCWLKHLDAISRDLQHHAAVCSRFNARQLGRRSGEGASSHEVLLSRLRERNTGLTARSSGSDSPVRPTEQPLTPPFSVEFRRLAMAGKHRELWTSVGLFDWRLMRE